MKQIYIAISTFVSFLFFISNSANAQLYHWAKSIGSTTSECGYDITTDAAGNVYTTGAYQGSVDFDPGTGTNTMISSGSFDVFITKFSSSGNFIWSKSIGGLLDDRGYGIALDPSGGIYVTGYFKGVVDFDPSTTGTTSLTSIGVDDMFICKLNANGDFAWVKQIGGTEVERGKSITIDNKGNILVTGYFSGTTDFDPSFNISNLSSSASTFDIFALKLRSNGDFAWAKKFGAGSLDEGHKIVTDATGNAYLTGEYGGSVDFDPGAGINILNCIGVYDVFVVKIDTVGNLVWAKSFGSESYDSGAGIAVDGAGNVYTTGLFGSVCDFDPGIGVVNLTAAGGIIDKDIFISKLNASGAYVWAKRIGDQGDDNATAITLDGSGNIYTTGVYHGTVDFDPGAGTSNLTTGFGTDIYISKLDASGNFGWAKSVGGDIDDDATAICIDASGNNIYLTGEYQSTGADFDPGTGVAALTSLGSYDIFILKLGKFNAGITNNNGNEAISIYPNPTNGNIFLDGLNVSTETTISITDLTGRVVYTNTLNQNINNIDLTNLPNGMYFIQLVDGEKTQSSSFVKRAL